MTDDVIREFPPCGLYRTRAPVGDVPAGRLVYFHNHGEPGPGIYLPSGWKGNRARFHERGHTLPGPEAAGDLEPLPAEGFYRVISPFHCCEKECRRYETDSLVQLGYDASAQPILFTPEWNDGALSIPEQGMRIDLGRVDRLARLAVATGKSPPTPEGTVLH